MRQRPPCKSENCRDSETAGSSDPDREANGRGGHAVRPWETLLEIPMCPPMAHRVSFLQQREDISAILRPDRGCGAEWSQTIDPRVGQEPGSCPPVGEVQSAFPSWPVSADCENASDA